MVKNRMLTKHYFKKKVLHWTNRPFQKYILDFQKYLLDFFICYIRLDSAVVGNNA